MFIIVCLRRMSSHVLKLAYSEMTTCVVFKIHEIGTNRGIVLEQLQSDMPHCPPDIDLNAGMKQETVLFRTRDNHHVNSERTFVYSFHQLWEELADSAYDGVNLFVQ